MRTLPIDPPHRSIARRGADDHPPATGPMIGDGQTMRLLAATPGQVPTTEIACDGAASLDRRAIRLRHD